MFTSTVTKQINYSEHPKAVENIKNMMSTFSVTDYEINYDTNTFSIFKNHRAVRPQRELNNEEEAFAKLLNF